MRNETRLRETQNGRSLPVDGLKKGGLMSEVLGRRNDHLFFVC
jgi:hypothetical protein